LSSRKQGCIFCFPGAGDDAWDDRREDMNSAIDLERLVAIAEKEVGTSDGSSVRAREVRRVDMREKNHVTGVVYNGVGAVTGGVA
jgi:hypothetical protein